MSDYQYIPVKGAAMKTYVFRVVIEPDTDRWMAYCPALLKQGGTTWGRTKEEALKHIHAVVHMVVDSLAAHREPVPETPTEEVEVSHETKVAVTL